MGTTAPLKSNDQWQQEIENIAQRIPSSYITSKSVISEKPTPVEVAGLIDHTLLKLDATQEQIDKLIDEALHYGFKTVCIRLPYVAHAASRLKQATSGVCCVIGFHEGTYSTAEKLQEAKEAIGAGATELDFVLNRDPLKLGHLRDVFEELAALRSACPASNLPHGITTKLILETSQLSEEQIIAASYLGLSAGFDFIKTSTGFLGHGAKVEHVRLMRAVANLGGFEEAGVKASGGVRTWDDAQIMLRAGATRLGVSAGIAIIDGLNRVDNGQGSGGAQQDSY